MMNMVKVSVFGGKAAQVLELMMERFNSEGELYDPSSRLEFSEGWVHMTMSFEGSITDCVNETTSDVHRSIESSINDDLLAPIYDILAFRDMPLDFFRTATEEELKEMYEGMAA